MDRFVKWMIMALGAVGLLTAFRSREVHEEGDADRQITRSGVTTGDGRSAASDSTSATGPHRRPGAAGHRADTPIDIPPRGWKAILRRVKDEFVADKVGVLAAAVAFAGLLALFPLMIAAISIYGLVTDPQTVASQADAINDVLPSDAASLITGQLRDLATSADSALGIAAAVSILGALWSASGGMGMLINALNVAYDEDNDRGFVKHTALALALTLAAILFLAVVVGLLTVPADIAGDLGTAGILLVNVVRWVVLAGLLLTALAVLYRVAHTARTPVGAG